MQDRQNFLPFFLIFFTLSLLLILIGKFGVFNSALSYLGIMSTPLRSTIIGTFTLSGLQNQKIEEIISENLKLRRQIVEKQDLSRENEILKNQFDKSIIKTDQLLPAKIIGAPGFIPGESIPEYIVIDKGQNDGIKIGSVVIIENNIIGKADKVNKNNSKIMLSIKGRQTIPAVILKDEGSIQGILRGTGDGYLLENVVLAEDISEGDVVITKGNFDEKGRGYPPDLIAGEITSVEKESSDLFQVARVKSIVDFSDLELVFVIR